MRLASALVLVALAVGLVAAQQPSNTNTTDSSPTNTTAPPSTTTNTTSNTTAINANDTATATPPQPAAASVPAPANGQCARQCVRKEFRALTPQERMAFLAAVKRLMQMPARDPSAPAPKGGDATPKGPDATPKGPDAPKGNGAKGPDAKGPDAAAKGGPKGAPKATAQGIDDGELAPELSRRQDAPTDAPLNGPSEYDRLVKMHIDAGRAAHGNDYFIPWHRAYLMEWERALQSVDPTVCIPYWNTNIDSQAPEYSPLLTAEYFGGNGQGEDNCVQDGYFAGWQPAYPERHCLRRAYSGPDGTLGSFHSVEQANRVVSTVRDYGQFRRQVEGLLHSSPHTLISGDMSTMASPNDPLFLLHHGYVDYLYSRWQKRNGMAFSGDVNAPLPILSAYRTADVLDSRALCYDYADVTVRDLGDDSVIPPPPPPSRTPRGPRNPSEPLPDLVQIKPLPENMADEERYSSRNRANLGIIRYADPTPREWCERMGINYEEVTQYETESRTVCRQLNEIKGYVSPCALLKRPTLSVRIVQTRRVEHFYVDVPEVGRVEVGYKAEVAAADPYQALSNVKQRVFACAPDVERPPEEYRATVQKLIGSSAFSGASDPLRVTNMDDVKGSGAERGQAAGMVALVAVAVAAWVVA